MGTRPISKPAVRGPDFTPRRTEPPPPQVEPIQSRQPQPPSQPQTEIEEQIRQAYLAGQQSIKPAPVKMERRYELPPEAPFPEPPRTREEWDRWRREQSIPPQPNGTPEKKKTPISWILFNRRPFHDKRMRMARAVIFLLAGTIAATIGQALAGSYFNTATKITGTFGTFVYTGQVGTILLILGIVLLWEGVKS